MYIQVDNPCITTEYLFFITAIYFYQRNTFENIYELCNNERYYKDVLSCSKILPIPTQYSIKSLTFFFNQQLIITET
jgi:hypothetical protein